MGVEISSHSKVRPGLAYFHVVMTRQEISNALFNVNAGRWRGGLFAHSIIQLNAQRERMQFSLVAQKIR